MALDHGLVMGPLRGIERAAEVVSKVSKGPDALQMTPALAQLVKENFASRGGPLFIARLDTTNVWREVGGRSTGYYSMSYTVKEAVRAGADAVICYLLVGLGNGNTEALNLEKVSEARREANDYGVPFIVEPLAVKEGEYESLREPTVLKYLGRFGSELGADVLKLDFGGDSKQFREVVDASFSPIVIRGGPKTKTDLEFLQMLADALAAGAKGVTVGRNIWQSSDPVVFTEIVSKVVHEGADPRNLVNS
ncbi:aldolase [Sulfodiicoccus acidiphilus]|uniref:Aldolase n=1 Tax=Sulfodiicoccus acidiphilus TaxID=1670455 RepID=A0A348B445_9CREN|nr:aldolase [Sulfodiicoccus acidiphilus]GGT87808.1 aldolase [Sulfodiicoccus acidiphilus]